MAEELGIKINELGAAQIILGTEFVPIDNGVDTLKATLNQVKEHAIGDNNISALGDGSVTGAILNVKSTSETADSNIAETMAQNGAHNYLPNELTTQVINGLTVTVNEDKSVTINGTANAGTQLTLMSQTYEAFPKKDFILSNGGYTNNDAFVFIERRKGAGGNPVVDVHTKTGEMGFTVDYSVYDYYTVGIWVANGTTLSNVTFKPMITLASDPSTEYAPHAMTNRELTEVKSSIKSAIYMGGTTDSYGNILTNMSIDSVDIIGARLASALIGGAIPMISATSDKWFFKCVDANNQPFANQAINVKYYYYE